MERIRVCNLRCLADTGLIEIKPITVLVGANSSGKSTFLRVFPLLRQSAETRTLSGLLLNEGDVNFGFFPDAIHRDAEPSELKLEFEIELRRGLHQGAFVNRFLVGPMPVACEISYARRAKDSRYPFLRAIKLQIGREEPRDILEISANEEGKISTFHVNGYQGSGDVSQLRLRVGPGLIPGLIQGLDDKDDSVAALNSELPESGAFEKKLLAQSSNLFHGRTSTETRLATLRSIPIGTPQQMLARAKTISEPGSWEQQVRQWNLDTPIFRNVRNLLLARAGGEILSAINAYVSQLARSVQYFQPVRASVQRDYLSRDVQVASVDPSGLNVAMVLASLKPDALGSFRKWMLDHFGFEVHPQAVSDGARVALRMKEGGSGVEFNLADMGFGFSQMLPFIVQIWKLIEHYPKQRIRGGRHFGRSDQQAIPQSFLVAIEQPELHLHPALQARLADLFVEMATLSRGLALPVRFVLETHSPTIIERIGSLVEAQHIPPEDVQVLLFERRGDGADANTATVRTSNFDSAGVLQDWPFGFLSPPSSLTPMQQPSAGVVASSK